MGLSLSPLRGADSIDPAAILGGQSAVHMDSAEEMAKALQNPLAAISALMTDNDIGFGLGNGDTGYSFQIQPVYAIDFPDAGFTFIPRAVIPFSGVPGEADLPRLGDQRPPSTDLHWGIGDIMTQFFFVPHSGAAWKWGIGPQISWKTRTDDFVGGPGWGTGLTGIVTGPLSENIFFAGLVGNHWGFDGGFNSMSIQPSIFYNVPSLPGVYLGYNGTIAADWQASSGNTWVVPLGGVVGRTFDFGDGHGLDVNV
ncbi:MAG: hypothetical protein GXP30_12075, partial [Verrucomicrobia bacterium]|nr:hypothetical protein [Verrucomicrobiota bacterium]